MMRHYWADYKSYEFNDVDPDKTIAIMPTAAIEQHGPHLPVGVDTFINQGMLDTLIPKLTSKHDVRILPVQAVGKSNEHLYAPGTLTIPADLAIRLWTEIGLSVARAGVRKMIIVNSHGGNVDVNSIVSRELRVQAGMFCVKTQWTSFGHPDGMFSDREMSYGLHGGDVETSLMLHFHPNLVDMSKAIDFSSTAETNSISPIGPTSYGWIASDLNEHGVVGDASSATAEKGKAVANFQTDGMVQLLDRVAKVNFIKNL